MVRAEVSSDEEDTRSEDRNGIHSHVRCHVVPVENKSYSIRNLEPLVFHDDALNVSSSGNCTISYQPDLHAYALSGFDGGLVSVNTEFMRCSGFSALELQELNLLDLTLPDEREENIETLAKLLATTKPQSTHSSFQCVLNARSKAGTHLYLAVVYLSCWMSLCLMDSETAQRSVLQYVMHNTT